MEVVLIVFAVLLALAVDECRQDRMRVRRRRPEPARSPGSRRFVEVLESQVSAVVSVERSLVGGYRELLAAEVRQAEEP